MISMAISINSKSMKICEYFDLMLNMPSIYMIMRMHWDSLLSSGSWMYWATDYIKPFILLLIFNSVSISLSLSLSLSLCYSSSSDYLLHYINIYFKPKTLKHSTPLNTNSITILIGTIYPLYQNALSSNSYYLNYNSALLKS